MSQLKLKEENEMNKTPQNEKEQQQKFKTVQTGRKAKRKAIKKEREYEIQKRTPSHFYSVFFSIFCLFVRLSVPVNRSSRYIS